MRAMSVRLDEATYSELEERSTRLGIPPAVLARSFILVALADVELSPQDPLPTSSPPGRSSKSSAARKRKRGR
jgi:hypothetical protein